MVVWRRYPESGGAFKVQIYSPFIVVNKTRAPFNVRPKSTRVGSQDAAGNTCLGVQSMWPTALTSFWYLVLPDVLSGPSPFCEPGTHTVITSQLIVWVVLSHTQDQGNEFFFKLADSTWSRVRPSISVYAWSDYHFSLFLLRRLLLKASSCCRPLNRRLMNCISVSLGTKAVENLSWLKLLHWPLGFSSRTCYRKLSCSGNMVMYLGTVKSWNQENVKLSWLCGKVQRRCWRSLFLV